jgi:hypothetical protein
MNRTNLLKLQTALGADLPPGFRLTEWDSFINYALEGQSCRAIRIVGKARHLVLFHHDEDMFTHSFRRRAYTLRYLNQHNEMVEFDADMVQAEWRKAHGKPHNFGVGWERAVSWWLAENGAMSFTGLGWADNCSLKVRNLVTRWQRHYSGGTFKGSDEEATA